jgi:cytochrome b6-f complex iron-sulfur subunit
VICVLLYCLHKETLNFFILMDRKEFISLAGASAGWMLISSCLNGCSSNDVTPAPANVDFTLDIATGALATNGGSLIKSGVLVARTTAGAFIAVSAACTHDGTTVEFQSASTNFNCPRHGSKFTLAGAVINGPASKALTVYKTTLTGTSLRVTA